MEFNNPTTQDSVCSEIDRICGSTDVTYPLKDKTARVNQALDHFYSIALLWDKNWNFDDSNDFEADGVTERDLPIAYTDIQANQQDIPFPRELLTLKALYIRDRNNNSWQELNEETDPKNTYSVPTNNVGTPSKYRIVGNSVLLDFVPNYSLQGGIMAIFGRNGSKFVYTDTTKEPGIPNVFHKWLAQDASLPFVIKHRPQEYPPLRDEVMRGEQKIKDWISQRNQTRKPRLRIYQEDTQ